MHFRRTSAVREVRKWSLAEEEEIMKIRVYCNFVPIRVARNLGKPTQTFANLVCVDISSPPTLKPGILTLKVPKLARFSGRANGNGPTDIFTLKAYDFASFDGNPRVISSHSTGRRAANHGALCHLEGKNAQVHGQPRRNIGTQTFRKMDRNLCLAVVKSPLNPTPSG